MSDTENRREPPRMNRRHQVFYKWNPTIESWTRVGIIAEAIRYAGLVAELDVEDNCVRLFAARRIKGGKRSHD